MNRGMFKSIVEHDGYKSAEKDWLVELLRTNCYWYDLLANPPPEIDTRSEIVQYLTALRKEVEDGLERRFIYFICTRKRVRFDITKKPKFRLFSSKIRLYVLVGRDGRRMPIEVSFPDRAAGQSRKLEISVSEKFISFGRLGETKTIMSIHDFLMSANIDLGFPTLVQYVGYTENPETRPTNGSHTGLSDVQARISNEDNDLFLIFNIFKVLTKATNASSMLNFILANAMTDEINLDLEGKIIEKCLISYFDSENQTRARKKELGELRNNLGFLIEKNRINSIQFVYEVDPPTEYWELGSSKIRPSLKHVFTVKLKGGKICIEEGSSLVSDAGA